MLESKSSALPLGDSPTKDSLHLSQLGWIQGFEPWASRATIWRANQLRYTHHISHSHIHAIKSLDAFASECSNVLEGIRTPDPRLRRPLLYPAELRTHILMDAKTCFADFKRVMGIEPTYPAWKAGVLPLNYTRIKSG